MNSIKRLLTIAILVLAVIAQKDPNTNNSTTVSTQKKQSKQGLQEPQQPTYTKQDQRKFVGYYIKQLKAANQMSKRRIIQTVLQVREIRKLVQSIKNTLLGLSPQKRKQRLKLIRQLNSKIAWNKAYRIKLNQERLIIRRQKQLLQKRAQQVRLQYGSDDE